LLADAYVAAGRLAEPQAAIERGRAVAVATGQRSNDAELELRAATRLANVLRNQDRRAEAGALLAARYAWFTEGFDTSDLVAARTLLAELR
jgi:hypothetical protein